MHAQPDLLYFGGMCRSVKVARMAEAAGMECTPHMSGGDLGYLYVAHFASMVPNVGPHQEFKDQDETLPVSSDTSSLKCVNGILKVPTGPGLGVTIDPAFIKAANGLNIPRCLAGRVRRQDALERKPHSRFAR